MNLFSGNIMNIKCSLFFVTFAFFVVNFVSARNNYRVETVEPPPTIHETKEVDAICFTPKGNFAVSLASGEIWIRNAADNKWALFAEGLHNPLGMFALSEDSFVVAQRSELSRVSDTDGDGIADYYECMTDDFGVSGNYHEFNFTPVMDKRGDIYFGLGTASKGNGVRQIVRGEFNINGRPGRMHASVPYRGWIMKYTKEGKTIPWASGIRTPNGLGLDLDGNLFVTDNQGDWVGTSKLFHIEKDKFYGHAAGFNWREDAGEVAALKLGAEELNKRRTRASVLFPQGLMANSPTQPLVDDREGAFGPFHGQMFVGEMNKRRVLRLMLEEVDGQIQGACIPFVDDSGLELGTNRMAFAPDNSLYVGYTKHGWVGGAGLSRIVWDGNTPMDVLTINITKKGFKLKFTKPLDEKLATDPNNYKFSRYWYRYHEAYGSDRYDIADVPVESVKLSSDGLTVDIELSELKCFFVHDLNLKNIKAKDGSPLENTYLAYTVNRLVKNTPTEPVQWEVSKK